MNFTATTKPLTQISSDLLVIGFFKDDAKLEPKVKELDSALGELISQLLKTRDFKGKLGETLLLFLNPQMACPRLLLLGLGKRAEYTLEKLRTAVAAAASLLQKSQVKDLAFLLIPALPKSASVQEAVQALVEGLLLSTYQFLAYKNPEPGEPRTSLQNVQFILTESRDKARILKGAILGQTLAEIVNWVRDLGNHPANVATPTHLAKHAEKIAQEAKRVKVKILNRTEIKKENMGALLAVARGSEEEPKFIILEYRAKKSAPTIVLVGKGITFDSGGINIKPSEKLEEMKFDMAGAATVMGVIKAAADLKLPLNLIGLIPATENLPSGKASKPGDIVRSRSGKSIEIVNTDAEGRLVLADALDYAKQYKPALVMDFATLTGAIVVALGDDLIGAFTNRENLMPRLRAAAEVTGEKIWPMPIEESYQEFLKSDFADLRNIGTFRNGDAINAAVFLQKFTNFPWIHLDIAGTAWATREKPYRPKGATGVGVRLAIEFLKNLPSRFLPRAKGETKRG